MIVTTLEGLTMPDDQQVWDYNDYLKELLARYAAEKSVKEDALRKANDELNTAKNKLEEQKERDKQNFDRRKERYDRDVIALRDDHKKGLEELENSQNTRLTEYKEGADAKHEPLAIRATEIEEELESIKIQIAKIIKDHKAQQSKDIQALQEEMSDFTTSQEEELSEWIEEDSKRNDHLKRCALRKFNMEITWIDKKFSDLQNELPKKIKAQKTLIADPKALIAQAKRHIKDHGLVAYTLDPINGAKTYCDNEERRPKTPSEMYEFVANKINKIIDDKKLSEDKIEPSDIWEYKEKVSELLIRMQDKFPNQAQFTAVQQVVTDGYLTTGISPYINPERPFLGRRHTERLEHLRNLEDIIKRSSSYKTLIDLLERWKEDYRSGKQPSFGKWLDQSTLGRGMNRLFRSEGIGAKVDEKVGALRIETGENSLLAYIERAINSLPPNEMLRLQEKLANIREDRTLEHGNAQTAYKRELLEIDNAHKKNIEIQREEQQRLNESKQNEIDKSIKAIKQRPMPEDYNELFKRHKTLEKEADDIENEHEKIENSYNLMIQDAKLDHEKSKANEKESYEEKLSALKAKEPVFTASPSIQRYEKEIKELEKSSVLSLEKKQLTLLMLQVKAAHDKYMEYTKRFRLFHGAKGRKKASMFYAGTPGQSNGFKHLTEYDTAFERIIEHLSDKVRLKKDLTIRNHSFTMYLLKELFNKDGGSFSHERNYARDLSITKIEERIDKGLQHFHYDPKNSDAVTTTNVLKTTFDGEVCNKTLRNRYRFYRINDERKAVANTLLECYKRRHN